MVKSILLVGVGGQGTILASKILTSGLVKKGYDVKMSEIHGMSQRGGAVTTHVRYGKEVHSSVIEKGGADVIIAFEQMEALRWIEYIKPEGSAVINSQKIKPGLVLQGKAAYAEDIIEKISDSIKTTTFNATQEAKAVGNPRAQNILLMGACAKLLDLEDIDWDRVIAENVKPQFVDINQKAFKRGIELVA